MESPLSSAPLGRVRSSPSEPVGLAAHELSTDLLPLYLLRYEAENTKRAYANDLQTFFGSQIISLTMARSVSFVEVNKHLEQLADEGMAASTLQRKTAALRGFFAWLIALGLIDQNPADRHLVRRGRHTKHRDRVITVLSREEAQELVSAVNHQSDTAVRDQALLLTLLHCVLRRSEARAMDFEHFRTVGSHHVLDLPKTKGGSNQYIKVPTHLIAIIDRYKDHYGYESGPVWRSLSNNSWGKRLSATSIYTIVRRTAERAGIQGRIGAHTLRHTGCTLAIEAGATIQQVQAHARHKNLETTMIYIHQRDKLSNSAADFITLDGNQTGARDGGL